ncbi:MAG: biotin/lipoyl-binding protein [Planctomycetes bacterium]|nr:biotin/lipoyl-binding protein [Planctomycetota bacterium]
MDYAATKMDRLRRVLAAFLGLALMAGGASAMAWMLASKPAPVIQTTLSDRQEVAVTTLRSQVQQAPVVGHGVVRAKRQVNIVPRVSGQLVFAHQNLAQGKVIPQGDLLFEIDRTVYESRVRQAEAEIRGLEAAVDRLDAEMAGLDERIANAEQLIAIDERDYATTRRLFEVEKVGTQRDVDLLHQKHLRSQDALVELKSKRAATPHLKTETQAQLDAARARLTQAQHDMDATRIACPFKARVEAVSAQQSQVVTAHFSIATLTDMGAFEISVGIDPRELQWLDAAIRPAALDGDGSMDVPSVKVIWSLPGQEFVWRGRVTRFERVDEVTRTARMVVEVRDLEMTAMAGNTTHADLPALSIGMYCRAELPADPLQDALLVPRHAVYDDRWVYVFEPDAGVSDGSVGRLARREISVLRAVNDSVLVDYQGRDTAEVCELKPGDRVVVSPLTRPVVGMRITARDGGVAAVDLPRSLARDSIPRALAALRSATPIALAAPAQVR